MVQPLCFIRNIKSHLSFRSRIEADLGLGFYKLKMPKGRYVDTLTINWHITEACNFQVSIALQNGQDMIKKRSCICPSKWGFF